MSQEIDISFPGCDFVKSWSHHRVAKLIKSAKTDRGKDQVYQCTMNTLMAQLQFWERAYIREQMFAIFRETVPELPKMDQVAIRIVCRFQINSRFDIDNVGFFWHKFLVDFLRKDRMVLPEDTVHHVRRILIHAVPGRTDTLEFTLYGKQTAIKKLF